MFSIDLQSRSTISEQIINNLQRLIGAEVLKTGEKLPAVRELSEQLTVAPNTVQKAYAELERDGWLYSVSGRGTFVAAPEQRGEQLTRRLLHNLRLAVTDLLHAGITKAQIIKEVEDCD